MGIISKIRNTYGGAKMRLTTDPSPTPGWSAFALGINTSVQDFGRGSYVKAYENSAALYSVMSLLIRKCMSIPWYPYELNKGAKAKAALNKYRTMTRGVMNGDAVSQALIYRKAAYDDAAVLESGHLADIMKRPNANQGFDQFIEAAIGFYGLSGEANIYGNSGANPKGRIVEMTVLPSAFVQDHYGQGPYEVLGHTFAIGQGVPIAKENLMRWKNWRPSFDYATRIHMRGLSPVQVAWNNYLMSEYAGQQAAQMLKNGGAKGALSPQPVNNVVANLTEPQLATATQAVNQRLNGVDNTGNIGVLARPYDYLSFGLNAVDMQILETMKFSVEQWCQVLGVPLVLFSPDNMADNNYQNAQRDLVTNTVVPLLSGFRDRINNWLLPRLGLEGTAFMDFDISALPEMQRDFEKLVNSLKQAYWWKEDEKRVAQNMDPLRGPYDTSLVPAGLTPIELIGQELGGGDDGKDGLEDDEKRKIPY